MHLRGGVSERQWRRGRGNRLPVCLPRPAILSHDPHAAPMHSFLAACAWGACWPATLHMLAGTSKSRHSCFPAPPRPEAPAPLNLLQALRSTTAARHAAGARRRQRCDLGGGGRSSGGGGQPAGRGQPLRAGVCRSAVRQVESSVWWVGLPDAFLLRAYLPVLHLPGCTSAPAYQLQPFSGCPSLCPCCSPA